jgi:periplasmic divalent cation tolerance protein
MNDDVLLVITNLPDHAAAETLGRALVERRAAACVNVLSPCLSVYRWQGAIETATEHPVFAKTTRERYPLLEQTIRELHPYELPEIVAVPLALGLPAYLQWVQAETREENLS